MSIGLMNNYQAKGMANLPAMAAGPAGTNMQPGAAIEPMAAPEVNPFGRGMAMAMFGPRAANELRQDQTAPWQGQVAGHLIDQLFGGGRNTPITAREIYAGVGELAPQLMGRKDFMERLLAIGAEHNSRLTARDKNLLSSLMQWGGQVPTGTAQGLYDRTGYALPGVLGAAGSTGLAAPATGLAGGTPAGPTGLAAPATKPAGGSRDKMFPGQGTAGGLAAPSASGGSLVIPSKTQRELAKARAQARAQQEEQTTGHRNRRRVDQTMPAGTYIDYIDPDTGEKKKVWSFGRGDVDAGRAPYSVGDIKAQVMRKAGEAAKQGKKPEEVLNSVEMDIYKSTLQEMMDLPKFLAQLGMMSAGQGGGAATTPPAAGIPPAKLSADEARAYLRKAGGDKAKARALARQDGRTF